MICRRCGMESSTTDTCEWCKKPMIPEGGSISMKAKQELLAEQAKAAEPPQEEEPKKKRKREEEDEPAETEDEARVRRPEAAPPPPPPAVHASGLLSLGAHLGVDEEPQAQPPSFATVEQDVNDSPLMPLGSHPGGVAEKEEEEAKDRPIYIGDDESLLKPVDRPLVGKDGTKYIIDASGRKKRVYDTEPEIPDKVRLFRGTVQGAVIAVVMALLQFIITKQVPNKVVVMAIGDNKSFGGALQYGILSAILFGFMFAALLVNFKKGPVVGFLIGFPLGYAAVSMADTTNMPWPLITGVLCGIIIGKTAVKGVRRVVNV